MSTGVLITLIICGTLLLLVGLILGVGLIAGKRRKKAAEKLANEIINHFNFDDLDE